MNEVTKIHLGRQPFNISVAAHKQLRSYLDAIEKQVADKDVLEEVETRMAELLTERGIKGDKVILAQDVEYLKEQLGNPKDFNENSGGEAEDQAPEGKRLFRDTDNAMLAGVASGLARFFGVDVWLIRILFIVGTIAWGGSLLVYGVLWLLVPEAKSPSEKLQMQGKSVTLDNLKEVVERADVKGAASRANKTLAGPINQIFAFIVRLVGIGFVIIGLSLLLSLLAAGLYLIFHGNVIMDNIFPVGVKEQLLVYLGFFVIGMILLFIILIGMAIYRRKWPIRGWLTGVLVGLTFITLVAGSALAADAAPRIRDRYNGNFYTQIRNVQPFINVNTVSAGVVSVKIVPSDKYYVSLHYYKGGNPEQVKTTVKNGTLTIDSRQYVWDRHCASFCLPNVYNMDVIVYTPNPPQPFYPDPESKLEVYPGSQHFYNQ